jgi:mRNA interferase RelE/StbE
VRQRIRRAIQSLSDKPRLHNSRKLIVPEEIALEARRLRLDRWRVIYVVDEEWSEIGVLAVRKRPPYDYDDLSELLAELD